MTDEKKKHNGRPHRCIDVWAVPPHLFKIEKEERIKIIESMALSKEQTLVKHTEEGPFEPNSLTTPAHISFVEEAVVVVSLGIMIGGPLAWIASMITILCVGTWTQCAVAVLISAILAYHPMPSVEYSREHIISSWWTRCIYKYFSYRFVWSGDSHIKIHEAVPWIGAGPPHGVMPFANVLSIPGINAVPGIDFLGAPASVVMNTPFLRYLTIYPSVPVGGASLQKATEAGHCVGIVPDGIAGIFRQNEHKEVVALKHRKGLARHALRTGTNILPAYSFGNTSCFSAWWDPSGYMEKISRKAQASIFVYWGRFGLPIPRRCQITMVYGDPIYVDKVAEPAQKQIDELHEKILNGIRDCFEEHKASLGWGDKELEFD
ncbi:Diacylglycerol O-acyltransferase 2-like protein 6 [Seminavis robusta]|uniref:Acyltransferase n=1 Tax=Seminavis robusta TaxID=568900 RepID=A0A9N8F2U4_9STRA|nr:Diacylglycerol O-acyltransferase 2-like protein 6 [Seminavis robusta]|eukprot:Sro2811_g337630.1 Diacylglycerol O-acyltransferase 2-like protein 6 (376) ;mRNA; f:7696-8905